MGNNEKYFTFHYKYGGAYSVSDTLPEGMSVTPKSHTHEYWEEQSEFSDSPSFVYATTQEDWDYWKDRDDGEDFVPAILMFGNPKFVGYVW